MSSQLKIDVIGKNKSKNSFGNSFVFPDDLESQNQFVFYGNKEEKNIKETNKTISENEIKSIKKNQSKLNGIEDHDEQSSPIKQNKSNKNKSKVISQKEQKQEIIIEEKQVSQQNNISPMKKITQPQITKTKYIELTDKQGKNKVKIKNQPLNEKDRHQTIEIDTDAPKNNKKKSKKTQKEDEKIEKPQQQTNVKKQINQFQQQKQQIISKQSYQISKKQHQSLKNQHKIIQKPQKFQKKVTQINQNISKLNNNLKDIKQNYAQMDKITEAEIFFKKKNTKKQRQIRDFLMQKRMQKQSRHQKINEIRQREKQIESKTIQQHQIKKQREKQEKIQKIKQRDFIEPKQKHKKCFQFQQQGKKMAESLIQRYKDHQPLHVRKQRQFQQQNERKKQQQQQILQQRKQRYQSLDLEQLQEHKRQYEQRRQQLENNKRQKRQVQLNKIYEDNHLMKDHIWKGSSHDFVDDELLEMKQKKQEPKEKVKKMKNYYEYIKNNFLPKTHQPKRSSHNDDRVGESMGNYAGRYNVATDDQHYDPHKKHVKKFKYFQGKAIGSVVESVPVSRSYSEQKKIGESYLEYLKHLPKKRQQSESTSQIDTVDLQMISRKFNAVTKVKKQSMPFYEQSTKKRTVTISQKPTKDEVKMVYEQLKNHDIKLQSKRQLLRAMKQNSPGSLDMEKDVNANLVLNMERKLDLLSKL